MGCYDSQVINRISLFELDACGRIPLVADNATPALKNIQTQIDTVTRTRNVTAATTDERKLVDGSTCTKPRGTPTDSGYTYTFTFCGGNPVFEAAVGYKLLDYDGEDLVGWEDIALTGITIAAMEIVFEPTSDACVVGESPQCLAVLIPKLESWVQSGDQTVDGEGTPDLVMAGTTAKSANLFGNYANSGELPEFLSHWAPKFADIALGRSWTISRFIDCPDAGTEDPCVFVAMDSASS